MSRKIERKLKKCQHIVEKETGTKCCTTPTNIIAICNSGLVNGLSQELVATHFGKYGILQKILMIPGKSCCFVMFKDSKEAELAYENIHSKLNIAQDNKPIYLSFSEDLPKNFDNCIFEKPPDLILLENFITQKEEELLLSIHKFEEVSNNGCMKNRQVAHYGYEFRYDINNVDKEKPLEQNISSECDFLWKRLCQNHKIDFQPDQLTINYYKPGHGIPPHVDTHSAFEDPIISLSLGTQVVMDFKHDDGRHYQVLLPRRSLAIISKECRYNWTHGITPRKLDIIPNEDGLSISERGIRTSFTFRKVLNGECNCSYTNKCDSFERKIENKSIDSEVAAILEKTHVQNVYDNIASHFSDTRHKPWPNVLDFVQSFPQGSVLVDVGCGNGKYLSCNNNVFNIGCDTSIGLLNVCRQRDFEVFTCNCLNIPIKDKIADGVISIAVIHHLGNNERRKQAISEIIRILCKDGRALIYVWAQDQQKIDKSSYLKQDRKNRKESSSATNEQPVEIKEIVEDLSLPVHVNRTKFQHDDVLVPWKLKNVASEDKNVFLRYYHVFKENELELLCKEFDNVEIIKSYYDQGNWCILLKKIK